MERRMRMRGSGRGAVLSRRLREPTLDGKAMAVILTLCGTMISLLVAAGLDARRLQGNAYLLNCTYVTPDSNVESISISFVLNTYLQTKPEPCEYI
jgi:hypothetical protein